MNTFKKNGVLVLAHGKMMDSEKCMTLINVFDADADTRKMTDYMKAEFAKQGAVITKFGFSETMPYDIAVRCVSAAQLKLDVYVKSDR